MKNMPVKPKPVLKDIEKLPYIDALRGLAILSVMMYHCGQDKIDSYYPAIESIIKKGYYGVQLFFIVSALTLFMSMDKRQTQEKHPYLNYFIRRFFRIAPLFYVAIIYYLCVDGFGPRIWLKGLPGISIWSVISTTTFTHGLNPYWINSIVAGGWTISIEVTFYLLLPFLYRKIKILKLLYGLF